MQLQPIIPFEPITTEELPDGDQWIAQVKWDGVRVLTYYDGQKVRLFNRKANERTLHYPEIADVKSFCTANSVILDGEIIALGQDGKPSFHEVMRRDGIRRMEQVKLAQRAVKITYMIFDVIFYNGQWINQRPLKERIDVLSKIIMPKDYAQLVMTYSDADALFEVIRQNGMEGIVIKDLASHYAIAGKDKRWQKKKVIKDLYAVVGGVTYRAGMVNALLLGLYDEKGQLWYIGHAGTGKLTQEDWKNITQIVEKLKIEAKPFTNIPERSKEVTWINPVITVKVNYLEWTTKGSLRQPSIQSLGNADKANCTFNQI
ncbi:RNA ligase family protein [Ammoniphilus resinae]|uniref:DNA ligase (ATP) n=1 Tax=Ammoniphilus resinae TaxID=861532 RepID=A0ABS4GLT9_9BACL|nr:RNA ligase family protein [Ammoniphilus resinae]MBP1931233.1 bifunctional non-homologous end joining protein LigD [Ammoniphilus resinae]